MINFENNPLIQKTVQFSLDIIEFCELLEEKRKFVIAKQLLRCGTSIGANAFEAQNPHSKNDFINKIKISAKNWKKPNIGFICVNIPKIIRLMKSLNIKL
ncbi:four helix bundle protein [Chryseobacterium indoltheticum]|uniref:four helix bundle protein n=1 Tax=Chryseobacterium indoltheticum TaxID=254 RepID=UPI0026D6DE20|nr:four helix bundle protein [Chryseobacterium indoltheticum]